MITPIFCVSTARVSTFYNTRRDFDESVPTMAAIRPKKIFDIMAKWCLLRIDPAELAVIKKMRSVASFAKN
jgi:hypothetical protein